MPIANCILAPNCPEGSGDLIKLWAKESGQSSEHMTLNMIVCNQQLGTQYQIMANLMLPSIWTGSGVSALQLGLSKALETHFGIASKDVHIITTMVDSGRVVENGQELSW